METEKNGKHLPDEAGENRWITDFYEDYMTSDAKSVSGYLKSIEV